MKIDSDLKRILGLNEVNQIGIVVRDVEKVMKNYADFFGITFPKVFFPDYFNKMYRGQPSDFRMKIALGMMGNLQVELIEVLQGRTIYEEFLERNGEGLHHLGFDIKDMDRRIETLKNLGIGVLMSGERVGAKFAYMDTEPIVGVVFEFIEREKSM
jgi:methylmalonyl-CoA/ethylmalonyl-CoA epimerase